MGCNSYNRLKLIFIACPSPLIDWAFDLLMIKGK